MIEEAFIQMYAHDFVQFAGRQELGQNVAQGVDRRVAEARSHAALMDARKGPDHLASLITRIRDEAAMFGGRVMLKGTDPDAAAKRHRQFLERIADRLSRPAQPGADAGRSPMSAVTGRGRRTERDTIATVP